MEEESWEMVERENLWKWWWEDGCWEWEETDPHLLLHQLGLATPAGVFEERGSLEETES